uniref:Uncharacterized protein n=1 Tax=Minutocellus polymorphus TaxID=265543 RepID=A0A7S0B1R8_9STRA|mmetsp:Transcript_9216/g.15287  ORF Transcript_9216/g.15287 Transcript_9216/m.15287 type:complete len:115 (+) Transcript_9216:307-651(+)
MIPKLIDYLEANDKGGMYPVDAQINSKFISTLKLERLVVSPSMVNHIGYISEHANDAHLNTRRISTDVRFQLDDHSYWKNGGEVGVTSNESTSDTITRSRRGKIEGKFQLGKQK